MGIVTDLYDFKQIQPPEKLFEVTYSGAAVAQAMDDWAGRYVTIEVRQGAIEAGDFVVIRLSAQGDTPEKTVQLNVGKGFYDPAFEAALIGQTVGTQIALPARDGQRTGTITQVKMRSVPAWTDALAQTATGDANATVADCREQCRQKLIAQDKKRKRDGLYNLVLKQVCEKSAFADFTKELEEQVQSSLARFAEMAQARGITPEELMAKAMPPVFDTHEKRMDALRQNAAQQIKSQAVAEEYFQRAGGQYSQEGFAQKRALYIANGMPPADAERFVTWETYQAQAAADAYQEAILQFFDDRFQITETV